MYLQQLIVVTVLVAVATAIPVPAPAPELVISQPLFYPHGRSKELEAKTNVSPSPSPSPSSASPPLQQQQKSQSQQQPSSAPSSYVPQVVKPPTGSGSGRGGYGGSRDYGADVGYGGDRDRGYERERGYERDRGYGGGESGSGVGGRTNSYSNSYSNSNPNSYGGYGGYNGDRERDRGRDRDREREHISSNENGVYPNVWDKNRDRPDRYRQQQRENSYENLDRERENENRERERTRTRDRGNFPTLASLLGYGSKRPGSDSKLLIAKPLYDPNEGTSQKQKSNSNGNPWGDTSNGVPHALDIQASGSGSGSGSGTASSSSNQVQVHASEQNAIEIPEMGGIEYYDLVNHIRSAVGKVTDLAVKAPGNVAYSVQTAWRGSNNLLNQVRENMPDIQLPELPFELPFSLPIPSLPDFTKGEDSYVAASQMAPLSPFPLYAGSFLSSKKRPPVESHWLDNYGV